MNASAPHPPPAAPAGLVLTPPDRLAYAGSTTRVGPRVWSALSALAAGGGRRPAARLLAAVWPDGPPGGRLNPESLYSLRARCNRALMAVGHPLAVRVEGTDLVLD